MTLRRILGVTVVAATLVLSACSSDSKDDSATDKAVTTSSVAFPKAAASIQPGVSTWVVLLAASGDPKAPEIVSALAAAKDAGYDVKVRTCDNVATVIGLPVNGTAPSVSVYFDSEAAAREALVAFHAKGFAGGAVGQIAPGCKA